MINTFIIGKTDFRKFNEKIKLLAKSFSTFNINIKINHKEDFMMKMPNNSYIKTEKVDVEISSIKNKEGFELLGLAEKNEKTNKWDYYKISKNTMDFEVLGDGCFLCKCHRKRTSYYFFKKENESIIQIGSSCLNDFFGAPIRKTIDEWFNLNKLNIQIKKELKADYNEFYSIASIYSATKDITQNWLFWEKGYTPKEIIKSIRMNNFDSKISLMEIKKGLEVVKDYYEDKTDPFSEAIMKNLYNKNSLNFNTFINQKDVGIISYAIYNSNRKKYIENNLEGSWVGEIGEKILVEGNLFFKEIRTNPYSPYYSNNNLYYYDLVDSKNNHFYMRTSKEIEDLVQGSLPSIKATLSGIIGYHGKNNTCKYNTLKGHTKLTIN